MTAPANPEPNPSDSHGVRLANVDPQVFACVYGNRGLALAPATSDEKCGAGNATADSAAAQQTLPELYSFEEHHSRFAAADPNTRMWAFLRLPQWQQTEAYATLRAELDGQHDRLAEAA